MKTLYKEFLLLLDEFCLAFLCLKEKPLAVELPKKNRQIKEKRIYG